MPELVLDPAEEGRSGVVSMLSSEMSSLAGGISSRGSGGIGGSGVPPPYREGSDAAGEGGGKMKLPARNGGGGTGDASILVLNSGSCRAGDLDTATEEGKTSVSKGGATFCFFFGELESSAMEAKPEERRETRVLRGLAALLLSLRGDLRADCRAAATGAGTGRAIGVGMDPPGAGVGGSSASIMSTCHDRFSSSNFKRSAYKQMSVGTYSRAVDLHTNLKRCFLFAQPHGGLSELLAFRFELFEPGVQPLPLLISCGRSHEIHAHLRRMCSGLCLLLSETIE